MMDQTDRHCRYFLRQLSRRALLYTEMVTAPAIVHGRRDRLLGYDPSEHPLALQVGGSDPRQMAESARIAEDLGYLEVNINVGCPSDRVRSGRFGACLMAEPELVARCVERMRAAVRVPITVKSRIGIDHHDSYEALTRFIAPLRDAGCGTFIIHARKAWLSGLSPKQNREVPPLRYDVVYAVKRDFPTLEIVLNGGITALDECREHLRWVDGVMLGRAAYHDPYLLSAVDATLFGDPRPARSREAVVGAMREYVARWHADGLPVHRVSRHMIGLFHGQPGARAWRRSLSELGVLRGAGPEVLDRALAALDARARDAA